MQKRKTRQRQKQNLHFFEKNYIIKMALRAIFLFLSYGSVRGQNLAVLEGEKPEGILKGEPDASGIEEE